MKKTAFLPLIFITVIILIVGFACALSGNGSNDSEEPKPHTATKTKEAVDVFPTGAAEVSEPDPRSQTWLVLFYFDADDPILEEDIYFDLNEVEMVGSSDRVQMVAQIDRYAGEFSGDDDWSTARRYYLTQDHDLNAVNSQLVEDIGEVDMGNSDTLVDFATWAIRNYPADRVVLIMSDHGSGWPGGWTDTSPSRSDGNWIYLTDLEDALSQIIEQTGIGQFELVGLDACLMSMLEVYNGLVPYSHYAVASQETEPAMGWAYQSFLRKLVDQPQMSGADLSRAIVEGYIDEDQRIVDDDSRQRLLSKWGITDPMSAVELAQDLSTDITITAVELTAIPQLNTALDDFLVTIKNADQAKVAEARSYSQAFQNVFDDRYPSPYIDLSNFADFVVSTTGDEAISQSTQQLQAALADAVIAEKHGNQRAGATGISLFFPVSELYWNESVGVSYYTQVSRSMVSHTLWDDFLAFHYAGQDFNVETLPEEPLQPAPGAAQITIAPLEVSEKVISPNESVNIQTDITGDNVAYIYLVGLLKNNTEDKYLAYAIDYLQINEVGQELSGVVFPVWDRNDGVIHISTDWNLAANAVCDDSTCVSALVNPDKYTTKPEDRLYYVEGWYVYSDSGEKIEAAMYFNNVGNNLIRHIIANPVGNDSITTPSELTPKPGDQFITVNSVLMFNDSGQFSGEYQEGNTLTFGESPFYYGTFDTADPGNYLVGIMVMDMDGNKTWQFAPVTVSSADQEVTPFGFAQEGLQQSEYYQDEPGTGGSHPDESDTTGSFDESWQSPQAKTIRSIFIPLIGGLIGVGLAWFLVKRGPGKTKPNYSPYIPPQVAPPVALQSPPQLTTTPPQLTTTPPQLVTTPPALQTSPPQLVTTPPPVGKNSDLKG